jgi:hypothetical protein
VAEARGVLGSVRAAFARPAAWGSVWAAEAALAAMPALMWFGWMRSAVEHDYGPDQLFNHLDTVFRFDQRQELGQLDASVALGGALLGLAAMLVGAFAAGGWLALFLSRTTERGLAPFLRGGARFFWRYVRVCVLTLLLLALATWVCYGMPWQEGVLRGILRVPARDFERLETLASERTVFLLRGAQAVLHGLAVAAVLAWGTLTRTRLALFDTRSAVWAGVETVVTALAHPLRMLGPLAGLFLLEVVVVTGLGLLAHELEAGVSELTEVGVLFALGQVALAWRVVLRGARYHAAVRASLAVVRPIAKPDPWWRAPSVHARSETYDPAIASGRTGVAM